MEDGPPALYSLVDSYKNSLTRTLNEIGENICNALDENERATGKCYQERKYKISLEMLKVLQNYVKMLHISEQMLDDVVSNFSKLECDNPPEREHSSLNPFENFVEQEVHSPVLNELECYVNPEQDFFNNLFETKRIPEAVPNLNNNDKIQPKEELEDEFPVKEKVDSSTDTIKVESESIEEISEETKVVTVPEPERPGNEKRVTFALPRNDKKSTNMPSNSAVIKLQQLPHFDWRAEATKLFTNKTLRRNFKWVPVVSPPKNGTERKGKERHHTFDILDDELKVHQKCTFCHIESPSKFYVRNNQDLFLSLENALNEDMNSFGCVKNKYKTKVQAKQALGNFCFAFLPQKGRKWYRVEVQDWMMLEEFDTVYVFLIDYGEELYCSYSELKAMTELYSLFPKMAITCHLAGIYSPNPCSATKWSQECIECFTEMVELNQATEFVTIFVHKEGDSYSADFQKSSDSNSDTLGQILVNRRLACEISINSDGTVEDDEDNDDLGCLNLTEAITGYNAQDEARLCPFTDSSGKCFKGPSCKLEHGLLSEDGVTTDKVATMHGAHVEMTLPSEGDLLEVQITGYIDTCHFYVQILKNIETAYNNDNFKTLEDTMIANNLVPTYEPFKIMPSIGETVLIKHKSRWYRGRCVAYVGNKIEVFLVDYGNTIESKLKDLRVMQENFLYVPFQAIECILHDCQEKKDASPDQSIEFFSAKMLMQTLRALVIETGETLRLQLHDSEGLDMSYVLRTFGLGEDRKQEYYLPKNCILSCS